MRPNPLSGTTKTSGGDEGGSAGIRTLVVGAVVVMGIVMSGVALAGGNRGNDPVFDPATPAATPVAETNVGVESVAVTSSPARPAGLLDSSTTTESSLDVLSVPTTVSGPPLTIGTVPVSVVDDPPLTIGTVPVSVLSVPPTAAGGPPTTALVVPPDPPPNSDPPLTIGTVPVSILTP